MKIIWTVLTLVAIGAAGVGAAITVPEYKLRELAKETVRAKLKDPNSAQFAKVRVVERSNRFFKVCGTVNAKNAFGGYVGNRRFMVTEAPKEGDPLNVVLADEGEEEFRFWPIVCDSSKT